MFDLWKVVLVVGIVVLIISGALTSATGDALKLADVTSAEHSGHRATLAFFIGLVLIIGAGYLWYRANGGQHGRR